MCRRIDAFTRFRWEGESPLSVWGVSGSQAAPFGAAPVRTGSLQTIGLTIRSPPYPLCVDKNVCLFVRKKRREPSASGGCATGSEVGILRCSSSLVPLAAVTGYHGDGLPAGRDGRRWERRLPGAIGLPVGAVPVGADHHRPGPLPCVRPAGGHRAARPRAGGAGPATTRAGMVGGVRRPRGIPDGTDRRWGGRLVKEMVKGGWLRQRRRGRPAASHRRLRDDGLAFRGADRFSRPRSRRRRPARGALRRPQP